jgi:hypothetical protein
LLAQTPRSAAALARLREELARDEEQRRATLPQVAARDAAGAGMSGVIYAASTRRAVLMPDLRGRSVRDAARICAQLGLQLEARGEGYALEQSPAAGAEVNSGQVVRIDFGRSE